LNCHVLPECGVARQGAFAAASFDPRKFQIGSRWFLVENLAPD